MKKDISILMKIQCTENGNDIYCHPVHTVESRLVVVEPSRETRIGLKNQIMKSGKQLGLD